MEKLPAECTYYTAVKAVIKLVLASQPLIEKGHPASTQSTRGPDLIFLLQDIYLSATGRGVARMGCVSRRV